MLTEEIIEPLSSACSSLVVAKGNGLRVCVDYQKLNSVVKNDCYSLPHVNNTLNTLSGAQRFFTLNLKNGYWRMSIYQGDKEKTAFSILTGLFQFNVMPLGPVRHQQHLKD